MRNVNWGHTVLLSEMVVDCRSLAFFNTLVQASVELTNITCITQVTLKITHNTLLIHCLLALENDLEEVEML